MNKQEIVEYCLSLPGAYEDYPFDEQWTTMRHRENKKSFAFIYARYNRLCVNLKCDPHRADFLLQIYNDVVPGYHMNKEHWNTVNMDGDVPEEYLLDMIQHSYDLTKPKLWPHNRAIADANKIWPNNLYYEVFGQDDVSIPDNAEEAIAYVLNKLRRREREIMLSRYKEYKTLVVIGLEHDISSSRAGQLQQKAVRFMRHPSRARYLLNLNGELEKDRAVEVENQQLRAKMRAEQRLRAKELITIEELDLSVRSFNCLHLAKIRTLADLSKLTLTELGEIRNLGQRSCKEILAVCEECGVIIE